MTITTLHSRADYEARILQALQHDTYEKVAKDFGTSRGSVYTIALKAGARKNEMRIQERKAERLERQRDFLQQAINATSKADVLDFLGGLPDGSVQMHLTSPPYNVGKEYGGSAGADAYGFAFFLGWQLQVLSELARTLAPGGTLFYQVGATRGPDGHLFPMDVLLFEHIRTIGLTFQSRIAWVVPHGLTPKDRLSERYETALVFTKGEKPRVFNPTPLRKPQKQPGKRAFKGPNAGKLSGNPLGAHPSNVWQIANAGHNRGGRVDGHPAQMPLEMALDAVNCYTLPGDLVCDVFMGSGTTAAACLRTGRAFTGCDLFYNDVRAERLAAVDPDLSSVLPGVTDASIAIWNAEAAPVHIPADPATVQQAGLFADVA